MLAETIFSKFLKLNPECMSLTFTTFELFSEFELKQRNKNSKCPI